MKQTQPIRPSTILNKKMNMKKIISLLLIFFSLFGCDKEEHVARKIEGGYYTGTFQRESDELDREIANVSFRFSSNEWNGTSDLVKYPALSKGTFSIVGDTIIFNSDGVWTADFDWTLILSGKYAISRTGDQIEFTRNYRDTNAEIVIDRYLLTKQD